MKRSYYLTILLGVALVLFGCTSGESTITPFSTQTSLPTSTLLPSIATPTQSPTSTPSPTSTITITPLPMLNPTEARDTIKTLLQKPVDCAAPCFWDITPGQSTLGDAIRAITQHFGLQLNYTNTLGNKEFRESKYEFDSGLSISPLLAIQDGVVKNITIDIHPEKQKARVPREWLAYSPQTLINRYGVPSRVDFFAERGEFHYYDMVMYFDSVDLIAEYDSYDLGTQLQVCPLINQIDFVRIWMGQDPEYPPLESVPLEKATSMTMEDFSKLMMGDPNQACFNLREESFP